MQLCIQTPPKKTKHMHTLLQPNPSALSPPSLSLYPCLAGKVSACLGEWVPEPPNKSFLLTQKHTKKLNLNLACLPITDLMKEINIYIYTLNKPKVVFYLDEMVKEVQTKFIWSGHHQLWPPLPLHQARHVSPPISVKERREHIQMVNIVHCVHCFVSSPC